MSSTNISNSDTMWNYLASLAFGIFIIIFLIILFSSDLTTNGTIIQENVSSLEEQCQKICLEHNFTHWWRANGACHCDNEKPVIIEGDFKI